MRLRLKPQLGRQPAIHAKLLPDNAAQVATNTKLWDGSLASFYDVLSVNTPTKVGTKKSIYHAPIASSGTRYWFHWLDPVVVAESPVENQTENLMYFAGDSTTSGKTRYTTFPAAITSGTNYPITSWDLGVSSPSAAPGLAASGSGSGDAFDVVYIYAYVAKTTGGVAMVGAVSASATVSMQTGQSVNVTMATSYSGGGTHQVTHKRIYRTVTGESTDDFYYVAEVALATAVYNDALTDAAVLVNGVLDETDKSPPPANCHSIVMMPNGISVVAAGREVCPSVPYEPHAYPNDYRKQTDFDTVGLAVFGTDCLVLTTGVSYVLRGSYPDSMSMDRGEMTQACVSKRSIVSSQHGVFFASPTGLVLASPSGEKILTDGIIKPETWRALKPETILGAVYEGRYYGWYDTGTVQAGFVFDLNTGSFIDIDVYATATFVDPIDDRLYLQVGNDIVKWEGATTFKSKEWRSKIFEASLPYPPTACRVVADDYDDITLRLYINGDLADERSVTSELPFRLPRNFRLRTFEIEVEGKSTVTDIYYAESVEDLI